jgi:nucleolar GTP-binding protein
MLWFCLYCAIPHVLCQLLWTDILAFNIVQEENGGAGVYSADMRKRYALQDPSWRYDIMPEIIEGHNVLDFVDPDIEARLEALDREEEAMAAAAELEV